MPIGWYRVKTDDYTNSGFDRGHLCPSDDRDDSQEDNDATFFMTNIIPQSPNSNRGMWAEVEEYCRKIAAANNELYIIAGVLGSGGSGSNGGTTKTLASGNITVPSSAWKVILILPNGSNNISRINSTTQTIAVCIPNKQSITNRWENYGLSIDELEDMTCTISIERSTANSEYYREVERGMTIISTCIYIQSQL